MGISLSKNGQGEPVRASTSKATQNDVVAESESDSTEADSDPVEADSDFECVLPPPRRSKPLPQQITYLSILASEREFLDLKNKLSRGSSQFPRGTWCTVTSEKRIRSWLETGGERRDMKQAWTNNLGRKEKKQEEWQVRRI